MPKVALALFLMLAVSPCFSQRSEVVVSRAQMVQVSTGAESPNITEVGTATIYYCYNVVYCGPPLTAASPTYSVVSTDPSVWTQFGNSTSATSSGLSQPFTTEIGLGSLTSIQTRSWIDDPSLKTIDTSGQSFDGMPAILLPSVHPFTGYNLGIEPALASTSTTSDLPCWFKPQASDEIKDCGIIASAAPAVGLSSLYTPATATTLGLANVDNISSQNAPSVQSLMTSNLVGDMAFPSAASQFKGIISDSSQPSLTLASARMPDLSGSLPPTITAAPYYGYQGINLASTSTTMALGNPYQSITGTDLNSLTQQLAELGQHNAKIVGWSILYESTIDTQGNN